MKKGFTIIEMLIVLGVIALITLITIPNISRYSSIINETGCKAQVDLINGAISAYKLKYGEEPTINDLLEEGLITIDQISCKNGKTIKIVDGEAQSE